MDKIQEKLDKIEIMIQKIPLEVETRNILYDKLKTLRKEAESTTEVPLELKNEIIDLEVEVELFTSGIIFTIMPRKNMPKDYSLFKKEGPIGNQVDLARGDRKLAILNEYLDRTTFDGDLSKVRDNINYIADKYNDMPAYSKDIEQKIARVQYELIIRLLEQGRLEEAEEFASRFSANSKAARNMRIFTVNKLEWRIRELLENGRVEEADRLNDYIYDETVSENDMKFWEMLVRIEKPGLDFRLPVENEDDNLEKAILRGEVVHGIGFEDSKELALVPQTGFFANMRQKRYEKWLAKRDGVKLVRVRFDKKNLFDGGANVKDLKKVYLLLAAGRKVKIVYEEGITEIKDIGLKDWNVPEENKNNIVSMKLPSTIKNIEKDTFLGAYAFKGSKIKNYKK